MPCAPFVLLSGGNWNNTSNAGVWALDPNNNRTNSNDNGVVCFTRSFRIRLEDGRYIFMDWHRFCGPTFYADRAMNRLIDDWWDDPSICKALDWFTGRGFKA